ncbi:magnesium transport protein MgtC [uncultured Clostridium sp.]|nr:magnesium transport protein MgtC [uncultured Clostridium sp.]
MVWTDFLIRISLAAVLGALIGLERLMHRHMAGIRTNVLVCVGACLFVLFSLIDEGMGDRSRVAAQVVTGIGFLGGGVIVRDGFTIKGLTTAATLWCTAAIGVLLAAGHLMFACIATALVLLTNILLRPFSNHISAKNFSQNTRYGCLYRFEITCRQNDEWTLRGDLAQLLRDQKMQLQALESQDAKDGFVDFTVYARQRTPQDATAECVVHELALREGVRRASWYREDHVGNDEEAGF